MSFGNFAPIANRSGSIVGYEPPADARFLLATGLIEKVTAQEFAQLVGPLKSVGMPGRGGGWGAGSYVVGRFADSETYYRLADGYAFEHLAMAKLQKYEQAKRMTEQDIAERVNRVLNA